ncbi:hypothetical protein ACFLYY_00760 [Patescibacteria group bacterium]
MLSKELIKDFQKLYKERFGEEISEGEAEIQANRLAELFKVVYSINKEQKTK